MEKFSKFQTQKEINETILNLFLVLEITSTLNESELNEVDLHSFVSRLGIEISKSNGIIDYIKKFTSASGKLLLAAIKGDVETVKNIIKSINKEEFLDFLFKLDSLTLHLLSGPIGMIEALTGWEIKADVLKRTKNDKNIIVKSFTDAITYIKDKINNYMAPGEKKQEMEKLADNLEKLAKPAMINVK